MASAPCWINDSGYPVHRFDPADTEARCGCGERLLSEWTPDAWTGETIVEDGKTEIWGWALK